MSRNNEVRRKFGALKESLWIGHTEETMKKHYLDLSGEEFSEAASG